MSIHHAYNQAFYNSSVWKRTRDAYAKSRGGLCELCLKAGGYTKGVIVHHRAHLAHGTAAQGETDINSSGATDWNNLILLCHKCHNKIHNQSVSTRYQFGEDGNLIGVENDDEWQP